MMNLSVIREKAARFAIGLVAGSSNDGIDAVLVRLKGTGSSIVLKQVADQYFPYTPTFRTRLLTEHMPVREAAMLQGELGNRIADAAMAMLEIAKDQQVEVDFIGMQGMCAAICSPADGEPGGVIEIGEPAAIAARTGLPVICEFAAGDIVAGGHGGPLAPYADWLLFKKLDREVACLNLGGGASFTIVTPGFEDLLAFDVGPANIAIDGAVRMLTRGAREMDEDGALAAKGMIIDEFFEYLLSHKFFSKVPPKRLPREEFGPDAYLRDALLSRRSHSVDDLIATVTAAVAASVVNAYMRFVAPQHEVDHFIIGGGGAKNKTLLKMIQKGLPEMKMFTSDQYGIPHHSRQAIAVAILGNEFICGTPANIPHVTGAKKAVVLGKLVLP
jgi:anhydro-N-acetylmuramic acid kinase